MVGGGLFPPIMAGLAAVGLPAAAAYVVAGGVSWGGIWSLAQDGAERLLGRRTRMGSPKRYLVATAVGLAVSALLLPLASRAIGPGLRLKPHAGTPTAYTTPTSPANLLKAEGEFLAYGALSEGATELTTAGVRALTRNGLTRGGRALAEGGVEAAEHLAVGAGRRLAPRGADLLGDDSAPLPRRDEVAPLPRLSASELPLPLPARRAPGPWNDAGDGRSPFGAWARSLGDDVGGASRSQPVRVPTQQASGLRGAVQAEALPALSLPR
jgi:hypothetical protein